nr:hypothetical protein [Actinomycetota bacterium]
MKIRRIAARALLLAVLGAAFAPAPALAQGSTIDAAADALQNDPVYVAPGAESLLAPADADRLRERIAAADAGPIYVAVLPEAARDEAGGSATELLTGVGERVGRNGTYAVVVGGELQAGSTEGTPFAPGVVPALADEAVQAEGGGGATSAVLFAFVESLGDSVAQGSADGTDGVPGVGLLPLLLVGGGLAFVITRRRRMQRERRELEEVREVAMDDLVALGDDLRALDLDVEMPDADPKAKEEYVKALGCYEGATRDLDRAQRPRDLAPVTKSLEEGRYAMASAKARLDGREPPEHRPPCFFDPRHGPSVRDVEWAPPGGAERAVPA